MGEVRLLKKKNTVVLEQIKGADGYLYVGIHDENNVEGLVGVHNLVAYAFLPPPPQPMKWVREGYFYQLAWA
jgi:hypothetical protein